MIHYIESNRINDEVLNNINKLIVIHFYAEWCIPCIEQTEVLTDVEKMYCDDVVFYKVDLDENNDMKVRYNVTGVPSTLFLKNGEEIERKDGVIRKDELIDIIEELK